MARTLIRSATILTMDDFLGDLVGADLLIEDHRIAAIGRDLAASDAEIVEGRGRIVIPGLINAHMHTWQERYAALPRTGRCRNISDGCMPVLRPCFGLTIFILRP